MTGDLRLSHLRLVAARPGMGQVAMSTSRPSMEVFPEYEDRFLDLFKGPQ